MEWLAERGITSHAWQADDGMHIVTDGDVPAQIAGFVPARAKSFENPLPTYLRDHLVHIRDYRNAVRNGTAVTNAQTTHVIADIIDALRYVNAKVTGD